MSVTGEHSEFLGRPDTATGPNILILVDHASNAPPPDTHLGLSPDLMDTHIAVDLGAADVARRLNSDIGCAVALARWTRLWVDLNRFRHEHGVIPEHSDGHTIPGNALDEAGREARLARYYDGYHAEVAGHVQHVQPDLIVFLHSFTPALSIEPDQARPWHMGMMYDADTRAAFTAMSLLRDDGFVVGDQLPYSGITYSSSHRRHGEAHGIGYFGLEMRQDLLADGAACQAMADRLAPIFLRVAEGLAPGNA